MVTRKKHSTEKCLEYEKMFFFVGKKVVASDDCAKEMLVELLFVDVNGGPNLLDEASDFRWRVDVDGCFGCFS